MKNLSNGENEINNFEDIAPKLAREDYFNHMVGLDFFLMANKLMTDQEFKVLVEKYNIKSIPTFSEKYADKKSILDGQPDGLVEQLDTLATSVADHSNNGTLTIAVYKELAEKMKVLCSQK